MNNKILGRLLCGLSAYSIVNYYVTCSDSILGLAMRNNQLLFIPGKKDQQQSQSVVGTRQ